MNVGLGLLLSLVAGLSTGIGSAVALFVKKPSMAVMSFSLGLSAGVMVYISFMELLPEGINEVGNLGIILFFAGMGVPGIIDLFVPEPFLENGVMNGASDAGQENPGRAAAGEGGQGLPQDARPCNWPGAGHGHGRGRGFGHGGGNGPHLHRRMFVRRQMLVHSEEEHKKMTILRSGIMTAAAIFIHNVPEGMATFSSTLSDVNLGLLITFAIVIHNIPEGVSAALPILCATGDRKKAFSWSFLSGLAEPAGALVCAAILLPFLNPQVIGGMLAFVAGIMVYISLDEILPTAHKYGNGHLVIAGIIVGMVIMSISLLEF
ncbi:MAG: zinc transporter ZupT [Candidatus Lokiarchaeota archaeon]|nr:zinc transporter ZupT [Candidatus Lokiarchaeota archaeon]